MAELPRTEQFIPPHLRSRQSKKVQPERTKDECAASVTTCDKQNGSSTENNPATSSTVTAIPPVTVDKTRSVPANKHNSASITKLEAYRQEDHKQTSQFERLDHPLRMHPVTQESLETVQKSDGVCKPNSPNSSDSKAVNHSTDTKSDVDA
jgi:hypothetical protein